MPWNFDPAKFSLHQSSSLIENVQYIKRTWTFRPEKFARKFNCSSMRRKLRYGQVKSKSILTSFPSRNIPLPSDTINNSCDIATFDEDRCRAFESFNKTVHMLRSWAIFVLFCSKVNCWRMEAPACSLNDWSNEWRRRASSPKLKVRERRWLFASSAGVKIFVGSQFLNKKGK